MTKTVPQQLNIKYGVDIFATKVSIFGCPKDGWSLPTYTSRRDEANKCVVMTIGVFRVQSEKVCGAYKQSVMSLDRVDTGDTTIDVRYIETVKRELLERLIVSLKD